MARRFTTYTVTEKKSRDFGKTFVLNEMPSDLGEVWALQATVLIWEARGQPIPDDIAGTGMAGLAISGVQLTDVREARALQHPSLAAMWNYIEYHHGPSNQKQPIIDGINSQIEEVATRIALRFQFLKLHTDFFSAEKDPTSGSAAPAVQPA